MAGIKKDHDEICADIVGRISELGGFQVEFPVYLTCYEEKGQCQYFVSDDKKRVYEFIAQKLKEEIYCLPPLRKSMSTIVQAGQKDGLYQQFKLTAAKELMHDGGGEIAALMPKLAPKTTNSAQDLLEMMRVGLKGVFNEDLRQLYRGLLDMAFFAKKISGNFYDKTMAWLDVEERQEEEETIVHTVHERHYSGFAYKKANGTMGYYTNAVYESTLSRREEMMIKGIVVSPIFRKDYYFNDISAIGNVVQKFKDTLQKNISQKFMTIVSEIMAMENMADGMLEQELARAEEEHDQMKCKCLQYYKALWQV